ncbi:MAG: hypothetical protein A2951_02745 [Candidatus Buchananbacteria bacterium RIFCSPLOWO2_01_FULL_56_15]|uniref:Uncharacterized protein n=2 Tax=Candidatus Buchananiibacteriota TaxID=1817903 RepID=A0A1G1YK00_9BACT|nr:MAG: hypothetical protein A3J59_03775 [Candidatus Buchananbacteria bacterium RIFCSPHIGHO2_02_FULL_56_16]OGY54705.1 MAG: hypothetical protein A2951_02745 [Candidatus Buchananbacteria bacterium RIFCSPLOWO2_01_FULL_56_15]
MKGGENKMKTLYQCEVCGYMSTDKASIVACEAKGNHARYAVDNPVQFQSVNLADAWIPGTICQIEFTERTHAAQYTIHVPSVIARKCLWMPEDCALIDAINEDNVRCKDPNPNPNP